MTRDALAQFAGSNAERFEILAVSMATSILSLALPLALIQVYDRILPNEGIGTAWLLFGGVLTALVLEAMLKIGRAYMMGSIAARFEHAAGRAVFDRLLDCDIGAFEKCGQGEHLERFNALAQVRDFYAGSGVVTWLDLLFSAIFLLVMYYLAGLLVLVPLGIVVACVCMLILTGWTIRAQIRRQQRVDDAHTDFLLSVLGGLHTVKGLAMEKLLARRYESIQEERVGTARELEVSTSAVTDMTAFFGQVAVVGIAGVGALMVIDGELTVGTLAACTLLSGRAFQPLQAAIAYWSKTQTINAARDRLRETFNLPLSTDAMAREDVSDEQPSGALSLRGIGLQFSPDSPFVFRGVDLELQPGEIVAITGPNGHGKSALLSVMAGMQSPTEGEVLLDGKPLADWNRHSLEQSIAYVPQHDALFSGTILDNITAFRSELSDRAQEIAELLGFAAQVRALPHGFGTQVGAGAAERVPGGLAQRIILARSMMDEPRLLLLDAAYTAMDYEGDKAVETLLTHLKGHSTIVLVTHRPSFMWLADRVHDLSDGVFETSGLHVNSLRS